MSARGRPGIALALALSGAAGCASSIPPPPVPYAGADAVGAVDGAAFVGDWRLVALNPARGRAVPERTLSYAADGTFTGEIVPTDEMAGLTGDEPIRVRGTWRVDAGRLVHPTQEVEAPGGGFVPQVAAGTADGDGDVAAEIYEVGADRIVVVGPNGGANALERR